MKIFRGWFLTVLICFIASALPGQNLCPNGGFEQLSGCPTGPGEISLALPWMDAGMPADLFSFCHVNGTPQGCNDVSVPVNFAGYSSAFTGSSYAGFYTKKKFANQRTYIQAPLTSTLTSGQLYKITAHFKRSSHSKYATNRIGISFSTGPLSQPGAQFIPITPQAELTTVVADTSNWTPLSCYYTGSGLEDHIVIGNFRSDGGTTFYNFAITTPPCAAFDSSAYYYVDDISVTPLTEQISASGDTMICPGQSTVLTGVTNTSGWWSLQSNPTDTIPATNNAISVNPIVNTTYLWHGYQSTYALTVSISSPPLVSLPSDTIICQGQTFLLEVIDTNSTYLWSDGSTASQLSVSDSGIYVVTVSNDYCAARDTFVLGVLTSPDVELIETAVVCSDNNETVTLDAGTGSGYYWTPGGDTTSTIIISEAGTYAVVVTQANGCTKTDTVVVVELCRETLYIPGAFTPNGDSKNDVFFADGTNILKYEIIIFNRWGQPVFSSDRLGSSGGWNGKDGTSDATQGLYCYLIDYEIAKDGGKTKIERKSGYFILLR